MVIENFNYIEQNFIIPSPNDPDFVVKMTQYLRDIAKELRYKQTISQTSSEQIIGQEAGRTIFGKKLDFGALPNNAEKALAHGISFTPNLRWRRISAIAQDSNGNAFEINYSNTNQTAPVSIRVDSNNVIIKTGSDRSAFSVVTIFLEYIKNI